MYLRIVAGPHDGIFGQQQRFSSSSSNSSTARSSEYDENTMSSESRLSLLHHQAESPSVIDRRQDGSPERAAAAAPLSAASFSGRDMVCFSHDWSGDPLSKTHLMRILSRQNRVLWVNSIGYRAPTVSKADLMRIFHKLKAAASSLREVEPNIFVLNPLAIPFYRFAFVRHLNRLLLQFQVKRAFRRLRFSRPINWVFNPAAAIIAGSVGEDKMIYYCVDEYAAFEGVDAPQFAALEEKLLRDADMVIVSARSLHQTKSKINPRAHLVRHGVDFSHFRTSLDDATTVPEEIADLPGPVIGYFGLMSNDWVDVDLLVHVARTFSEGSLVLLGKVAMDLSRLESLPNVHLPGRVPYETLPSYCKGFDVAIIPFPISDVTLNANPLKAREYLAAGLPVISTSIPEVEVLGTCAIGKTPDQFCERIRDALQAPGPCVERSETMRSESWESRVGEIQGLFDQSVAAAKAA